MAEQIRRDHCVMLGKQLDYLIPLRCTPSDPMNQYHRWPMPGDYPLLRTSLSSHPRARVVVILSAWESFAESVTTRPLASRVML